MASFTISAPGGASQTLASGEFGTITQDGSILGGSVAMGAAAFFNHGTLLAPGIAIALTAPLAYIENYGSISGSSNLGVIDGYNGVTFAAQLQLLNYGSIVARPGSDTSVILTAGGGNRITNFGLIQSHTDTAIELYDEQAPGLGNVIVNGGTISGPDHGAIYINNAVGDSVVNSGTIFGAITLTGDADLIENSGTIAGNIQTGNGALRNAGTIDGNVSASGFVVNGGLITGSVELGTGSLRNSGTIGGDVTAVGTLVNSGSIGGQLAFFGGDDIARLVGGTVAGGVQDFGGDDIFYVDTAVEIVDFGGNDTVTAHCDYALGDGVETLMLKGTAVVGTGNDLNNTLTGTGAGNLLSGLAGNDTISGGGGGDSLDGGAGGDSLLGGEGRDLLDGGGEDDLLTGDDAADTLLGGGGNDSLSGGGGDDVLVGGGGIDTLNGGGGDNVFAFRSVAESVLGTPDRILGFVPGIDVIDLSAIDANVTNARDSDFAVAAALTGVAGQLILRIAGGNTFIEGDVDGDGGADFSIRVNAVTALLATDLDL